MKNQPETFNQMEPKVLISTKKSIIFLALYVFIMELLPYIIRFFITTKSVLIGAQYNNITYIVLIVISIFMFKDLYAQIGRQIKERPGKIIGIALLGTIVILILNVISFAIFPATQKTENQQTADLIIGASVFASITVVLLAPIVEEIVFRYLLIGKLSQHIPKAVAVIFSLLCFGLIHVHSLTLAGVMEARTYIVIGAVITFIYIKNKNKLAYPIAAHVMNNLIATVITLLVKSMGL